MEINKIIIIDRTNQAKTSLNPTGIKLTITNIITITKLTNLKININMKPLHLAFHQNKVCHKYIVSQSINIAVTQKNIMQINIYKEGIVNLLMANTVI